jgi:hypothetical protein
MYNMQVYRYYYTTRNTGTKCPGVKQADDDGIPTDLIKRTKELHKNYLERRLGTRGGGGDRSSSDTSCRTTCQLIKPVAAL